MTIKIFISYSHIDKEYLNEDSLLGYLKGLEQEAEVEFWWDGNLVGGDYWDEEIRNRIRETGIALVLVSQYFLNSDYIQKTEIRGFLEQCRDNGLIILPVILSPCDWEHCDWLKSRQFLPSGGETIEVDYTEPGRRKGLFLKIRQDLKKQINRLRLKQTEKKPSSGQPVESLQTSKTVPPSGGDHPDPGETPIHQTSVPTGPGSSGAIHHDVEQQRQDLLQLLREFSEGLLREKWLPIVGKDFSLGLQAQIAEIERTLNRDFSLVILGDFKRGKSTLVNALLGGDFVTTSVLPETITVNQIRYGRSFRAEARLSDGRALPLTPEEIRKETLEAIIGRLRARPTHLQIEVPSLLLQGMQLVDTPGLGDFVGDYDAAVQTYVKSADAVIYVVSAIAPLSASEREFLQSSLRMCEFSKICFVVNRIDSLSAEEERRQLEFVRNRLARIFPNARVFGLSALEEYRRVTGQPSPKLEEQLERQAALHDAFRQFRDYLQESFQANRQLLQLDHASWQAVCLVDECMADIGRLRQALSADRSQITVAISECEDTNSELREGILRRRDKVGEYIAGLGEESVVWMNEFLDRLQSEVILQLDKYRHEDLQRHFAFFLSDSIRGALFQCFDYHQSLMMEKLKLEQDALSGIQLPHAGDGASQPDLAEKISQAGFDAGGWTFFDNIHLLFRGLGGVLGAALSGLAEKAAGHKDHVMRYRSHLTASLPSLKAALSEEVRSQYLEIASEVSRILESKYERYLLTTVTPLKQARELRGKTNEDSSAIDKSLKDIQTYISHVTEKARSFRSELQNKQRNIIAGILER